MKFSKLEQEQIKKLCKWANEANRFMPIRDFYACSGLEEGTGVICIYDEKSHQPKSVLYVDAEKCEEDEFVKIREYENNCLFRFSFIYKLERLGLITISKTSFPNTDSKGWACFEGYKKAFPIDRIQCFNDYTFIVDDGKDFKIIELDHFGGLSDRVTREVFDYSNKELSSKLDIFGLVTSVVSIEQELFELVSNGFKTYEDIQLEEAQNQTKIAHESLEEARKQTESANASLEEAKKQTTSANASLEEAKKQTKAAIDSLAEAQEQTLKSQDSLVEAQKQTFWSRITLAVSLILSIAAIICSILVPRYTPSTLDQEQFNTIQMKQNELIKTLNEIKISQIDNDSLIKELNLANESIDEISNTLKELKKMNSKRK